MKTIEGIHYIFDRYAFLNQIMEDNNRQVRIAADSPKERLRKAITLARALYHPDRQENSARDMKHKAEHISHLLADCARFLLNDEVRPLYDAQLQKFKDEKPHLVSASGTPLIDIHAEYFDVDALIDDKIPDTTALENYVQGLTHFNPTSFSQLETLHDTMPDNPQVKSLYKEALTQKYVHLSALEDIAWQKLGIHNPQQKTQGWVLQADDYVKNVNQALAQTRDQQIKSSLQARDAVARIGLSPLPLLLGFQGAASGSTADYAVMKPEEQQQVIEKLTQTARDHFDQRTKFVQDIAQQKQQTLAALTALTPIRAVTAADPADPLYHVFLVEPDDEDSIVLWARVDKNTGNVTPQEWDGDKSLAAAAKTGLKANSFAVTRNKEINGNLFLLELMSAIDRLCNPEPPAPQPVPPPPAPPRGPAPA
ncbi:MAG TPA: hypothetical protein VGD95_04290 [Micavibrio sp.]